MPYPPQIKSSRAWVCKFLVCLVCSGVIFQNAFVFATTVVPPDFDELIGEADVVFDGVVTAINGSWVGTGTARHIESAVVFQVLETLKGRAVTPFVLKTAGGAIGNLRMEVADGPKFAVGERMILFVEKNGVQFIPLVGIMHGQYRVKADSETRRQVVVKHDDKPIFSLREIGPKADEKTAMIAPLIPLAPMTPESFKAEIRRKLGTLPPR